MTLPGSNPLLDQGLIEEGQSSAARSAAANAGLFMQQYVRDLLPVSFSYALGAQAVQ